MARESTVGEVSASGKKVKGFSQGFHIYEILSWSQWVI